MMPEGPEVKTLVDQLQGGVGRRLLDIQFLSGRYVRNGKPDRFAEFAATMTPYKPEVDAPPAAEIDVILSWKAKGKFIYIILDDGAKLLQTGSNNEEDLKEDFRRSIWITLGMSGKFVNEQLHSENDAHGRWFLEVMDLPTQKRSKIFYHDMRNFGTLKFCLSKSELDLKLASLGSDILDPDVTTVDVFLDIVSKKNPTVNICKFLMDQSNLSGVGNYILAEGLYRAKVDPFASLNEISEAQFRALFQELQSIALESYAAQGMTRQKGGVYATVDGSKGQFEMQLQCYGRQFCPRGQPVIKETAGPHGRTIWYTQDQLFMPLEERFVPAASNAHVRKRKASNEKGVAVASADVGWSRLARAESDSARMDALLSSLSEPSWKNLLTKEMKQMDQFQALSEFLAQELDSKQTIYPPHEDLFSALNMCPLDSVKVVIVGQDPYHGAGQAHGLAFSVRKGITPPPSLKNMFKEAMEDEGIDPPTHGNLEHWAKQGVLLLNPVLTVRQGKANSHSGKGWELLTDFIIEYLNGHKEGLVFLLFGNPAHKKAARVDETRHALIRTSHPSPLGARKTASPFLGSRCFSRCNKMLVEKGYDPIDWNVR